MIEIYDESLGLSVVFQGKIKEIPKKRGYTEIESIRGQKFSEHLRGVINLSIEIIHMSLEDYEKLKQIFLSSNKTLTLDNLSKGNSYYGYYIIGDTLTLDEYEDFDNKTFYYKGELSLERR